VRDFEHKLASRSLADLITAFEAHSTDQADDVVIRRVIVDHLLRLGPRTEVRAAYLRWLPTEPDYNIRQRLTAELGDLCGVGDIEAADLLDDLARTEPNILHVRPMMEYMSRYIRTGEENPDR
jgi:hypothetical protein